MSKSPSLRRIQADIRELAHDPSERYSAAPLEDDMFEWHFTIRGADQTEFEGGVYHGRILLPPEYPFKPPHIVFLTPSGRFETGTKVCLSFSAFHPELWQPAWGIRLILEALISFLPAPADGAIGALDWTKEERKRVAKKSVEWCCPKCGNAASLLPEIGSTKKSSDGKFAKEIKKLHALQLANEPAEKPASKNPPSLSTESDKSPAGKKPPSSDSNVDTDDTAVKIPVDTNTERKQPSKVKRNYVCTIATTPNNAAAPIAADGNVAPRSTLRNNSNESSNGADPQPVADVQNSGQVVNNPQQFPVLFTDSSWITDPLVNGSIITVAAIVFLLYRKVESLLEELRNLDN